MTSTSTSSSKGSILFILTSVGAIPSNGAPKGWYLPEVAHPFNYLSQYYHIDIASPAGGKSPVDPGSVELFKDDQEIHDLSSYVAVLYPGGNGPMFDLPSDTTSQAIAQRVYESGDVVSAICHGFSNSEEQVLQETNIMPFLLETAIEEQGGIYEKAAEDWGVKVLSDNRVVTGQNPASAADFAKAVHQAIETAANHK